MITEDGQNDFSSNNSIFKNHGITKFAIEVLAGDDKQEVDREQLKDPTEVQKLYYGDPSNGVSSIDQNDINKQLDFIEKKWKDERRRSIKGRNKSMDKERSNGYLRIEPESGSK